MKEAIMITNKKKKRKWLKITLKVILILIILEVGLVLAGHVNIAKQKKSNLKTHPPLPSKSTYNILAVGDSMTYCGTDPWPNQLEEILNNRSKNTKYRVYGAGLPGGGSGRILSLLEANVDEYRPDMVISMMGIVDSQMQKRWAFLGIVSLIEKTRTYKLIQFTLSKLKEQARHTLIKLHILDEEIYIKKASESIKNEQYEQAENYLIKAKGINQNDINIYFMFVELYSRSNNEAAIESAMKTAIEIDAKNITAYRVLSQLYYEQNKVGLMEDSAKKILEIDPYDLRAYQDLNWIFLKQERYAEAEQNLKKVISIVPSNMRAAAELYIVYEKEGKAEEANKQWQIITSQGYKKSEIDKFMIDIYYYYQMNDEAEIILDSSEELSDEDKIRLKVLRYSYNKSDNSRESIDVIRRYIRISPTPEAYDLLRINYLNTNYTEDDLNIIKTGILLFPGKNKYYELLRIRYQQLNMTQKAEDDFKGYIVEHPQYLAHYKEYGLLLADQGRNDEYIRFLQDEIRKDKGDNKWRLYILLAQHYAISGRMEEQEQMLKDLKKQNTAAYTKVLSELAIWYDQKGKPKKARETEKIMIMEKATNIEHVTMNNYQTLYKTLDDKGIRLVAMQYPLMEVSDIEAFFEGDEDITYVENKKNFEDALITHSYDEVFIDRQYGVFGHCTDLGNRMIAENLADTILEVTS